MKKNYIVRPGGIYPTNIIHQLNIKEENQSKKITKGKTQNLPPNQKQKRIHHFIMGNYKNLIAMFNGLVLNPFLL